MHKKEVSLGLLVWFFCSPVNSLICPQGHHINVYVAAHVIRHSLKNYKQRDYESLLGWNYIWFFPTDSPYGLFVWSFAPSTPFPPPWIIHDPILKMAARVCLLHTPRLLQGSHTLALSSPSLQHPQPSARGCQPPQQMRRWNRGSHPVSGIAVWRDTNLPTSATSANFLRKNQKSHFCRPTYQDGNFWQSGGKSGFG